jgi:hypothetical protein
MKINIISTREIREKSDLDDTEIELLLICPYCLQINEIELDYCTIPMLWCLQCGRKACIDMRNIKKISDNFKVDPNIIDIKSINLNCGIDGNDIDKNFKYCFEANCFYITKISSWQFTDFYTDKVWSPFESEMFLKLLYSLWERKRDNYLAISPNLKKLFLYDEFMNIMFGKNLELAKKQIETSFDFSNLRDFFIILEEPDNTEIKKLNMGLNVCSFDLENPRNRYPKEFCTDHDGIYMNYEYYDSVDNDFKVGCYWGD